MRQLSTGIFDFPTLVGNPKAKYVDKTALLYEMANEVDQQFFISRPRRFGKSLMLSTLQAMFEGRRDLFQGLAIDALPWEGWDENRRHPVYNFTMATANGTTFEEFEAALSGLVQMLCQRIDHPYDKAQGAAYNFEQFLQAAAAQSRTGKIVILIDEYDEPVAKFLDDLKTLRRVSAVLHDFYEKLKSNAAVIRFLMLTGVTKLATLSVFSGLNHLNDLSMSSRFATLLGYTHEELDGTLKENVEAFGAMHGWSFDTARTQLLRWYDGYRFSPQNEVRVLNPVSLGKLFDNGDGVLKSYWETTGGATLIFDRLKAVGKMPTDLDNVHANALMLDVCDAATLPIEALLYQSGYLTIKQVLPAPQRHHDEADNNPPMDTYILAPPNLEVRASLRRGYISQILNLQENTFDTLLDRARHLIQVGDIHKVIDTMLFSLYAAIPPDWRIKDEAEAKRYFQIFFAMLGANPLPEFPSARGYADAVLERPDAVYVFEFKYDQSAEAAICQIRQRGYADQWAAGPRPVSLVGINFNPRKRNIDLPVIEPL